MKKLLTALMLCAAVNSVSHAQIALEFTFPTSSFISTIEAVGDTELKYVGYSKNGRVVLHNLDHSLYKAITVPRTAQRLSFGYSFMGYATKTLFNTDPLVEYLVSGFDSATSKPFIRVFNENGETVFSCNDCQTPFTSVLDFDSYYTMIYNTTSGAKMLVGHSGAGTDVYSLPGTLPKSTAKQSAQPESPSIIGSGQTGSAYPNPSNDRIRVEYTLPEGVITGEIIITDASGNEVKRYAVGNTFNNLLIERSELRSGIYFYKLLTSRGESDAKKLVVTR